jgi:ATP adenylyltransferase/5',5'''-P-1,P-4-tetraphosphate phosphorylase II
MNKTHLHFNTAIGAQKPENIRNKQNPCPFCDRASLTDILAEEGSMLLIKNKYPVLANSFQTVLVETDDCNGELSTYEEHHLHKLLDFGIKNWLLLKESKEYQSVIFFKNHGPFSGGTIAHPHMQIIGFRDIDYKEHLKEEYFEGIIMDEKNDVTFSLSTKPRVGFFEYNVKMTDILQLKEFANYLQVATHYILNEFPYSCTSYNVFFYHLNEAIYAKIVPRFVTSPIYIGYSLPQIPSNLEWMADQIRHLYFPDIY